MATGRKNCRKKGKVKRGLTVTVIFYYDKLRTMRISGSDGGFVHDEHNYDTSSISSGFIVKTTESLLW